MGDKTGIGYADSTWNPVGGGCTKSSPGCAHCFAEEFASRFSGPGQRYEGLVADGKWTGKVRLAPERLLQPLKWKRPRVILVESMSDLFHPEVPFSYAAAVFGVMAAAEQHLFLMLTKQADRMLEFFRWLQVQEKGNPRLEVCWQALREERDRIGDDGPMHTKYAADPEGPWPLPNVMGMVTTENQAMAAYRIPKLLQCDFASFGVSAEPLLGPLSLKPWMGDRFECPECDLDNVEAGSGCRPLPKDQFCGICAGDNGRDISMRRLGPGLSWVTPGFESGSRARPGDVAWVEDLVRQCRGTGTSVFVKQLGMRPYDSREGFKYTDAHPDGPAGDPDCRLRLRSRDGRDPREWPEALRVQETPCPGGGFRDALAEVQR